MQRLKDAFEKWNAFIPEREEARAKAIGTVDSSKLEELSQKKAALARLKAEVALLTAQINMTKSTYHKANFDAQWAVEKRKRSDELDEAIAEEISKGKSGYQLAQELGTKSINRFYEVKRSLNTVRNEQAEAAAEVVWEWSRFTGTQRYALAQEPLADWERELLGEHNAWAFVLMKGTIGGDLEGKECIFDFRTGAFISGDLAVYNSDAEKSRRKRADILAEVIAGTYAGKVKETPNPYFEETE